MIKAEVRIAHRPFETTREAGTEEVGESEIAAPLALCVVQRRLVRGDDAAAAMHEGADLLALRVGQARDVRENEELEWLQAVGVEQAIVDHLERHTRLDERLITP